MVVTTLYADWGNSNYQSTDDDNRVWRDLLGWATLGALYDYDHTLPEFSPGETVSITVRLHNAAAQDAAAVRLILLDPDKNVIDQQEVVIAVPVGQVVNLPYNAIAGDSLGIWAVDYILLDENGYALQNQAIGAAFVVSDPAASIGPNRTWDFWITAPAESWTPGSLAEFTFHLRNRTDQDRSNVQVRYGFPHHTWESGDPAYGYFNGLVHDLGTIPANTEISFVVSATMFTNDRLFAYLHEAGNQSSATTFQIWQAQPSVSIALQMGDDIYLPGDTVAISVTLHNLTEAAIQAETTLRVLDPEGGVAHQVVRSNNLTPAGEAFFTTTLTLPDPALPGFYLVSARAASGGSGLGVAGFRFEVPAHQIRVSSLQPATYLPGATNPVTFTLQNIGALEISGILTATLTEPGGAQVWNGSQGFTLAPGQVITYSLPVTFTEQLGVYRLDYQASAEGSVAGGSLEIPFSNRVEVDFDRAFYRAGEAMVMDVGVANTGRFHEDLQAALEVPVAAFTQTWPLSLSPGQSAGEIITITLPLSLSIGNHPLTVTLRLASGSQEQHDFAFTVPPSILAISAPASASAGEVYTLTITNVGGAATSGADYTLRLAGSPPIYSESGSLGPIGVGESRPVTFTVPEGAASGLYSIAL